MSNGVLPDHDWKVAQKDENPLGCELTTTTFKLSAGLVLIVTNIVNGIHCDTWLILERHSDQAVDGRRKVVSFVGTASSQTRALNVLRKYTWAVYRKDIVVLDLPF